MTPHEIKKVSKSLSYVLRHQPDSIGVELEPAGWIEVDTLLMAFERSGRRISRSTLEHVVETNDKRRFELSGDGRRIRARQGHSVEVDLAYEAATPPDVLYHGTATRNLDSILEQGLSKGNRHHVHMSTNRRAMLAVGMRHGRPVLLAIDAAQMREDGHEFFVTGNDVWLTDHVPPAYLKIVDD